MGVRIRTFEGSGQFVDVTQIDVEADNAVDAVAAYAAVASTFDDDEETVDEANPLLDEAVKFADAAKLVWNVGDIIAANTPASAWPKNVKRVRDIGSLGTIATDLYVDRDDGYAHWASAEHPTKDTFPSGKLSELINGETGWTQAVAIVELWD